ncbi:tumor necrosis factor receptor superfamily member 1A-like [Indicator indicator]|uniref:tumor necrosis factor receptor superfamily member 1A-like n=1 Tax=Indicator indicator TaxID=1002788 RepID=UPI0023DE7B58|nr:tumor necrosis factor receptor superfamily member 1A-like [Indicator indicator]
MAVGVRRAVGLSLVTLLMMAEATVEYCEHGQYFHDSRCCLLCPAGTYVAEHCSAPNSRGRCDPCMEGESFTAHENGLEECLPCRQCKDDQVVLRPCALTHDTECQCGQGYFCPAEGCEICQRCSTMCPEGKEIVQNCNATTDLRCGLPEQGSTLHVWFIGLSLGVGVLLLFLVIRKLKSDKAVSTAKDPEKGLEPEGSTESLILPEVETPANKSANAEDENAGETPEEQTQLSINLEVKNTSPEENSVAERGTCLHGVWRCHVGRCLKRITRPSVPAKTGQNPAFRQNGQSNLPSGRVPATCMIEEPRCQIIVKDLSQKELRDCFSTFIKEVPPKKWKQLMRTHLHENDIDKIIYDYPNNNEEQSYQMLLSWKNILGEKQSIIKLLDELRYLDAKAYDNVLNALKNSNVISKAEATD